MTCPDIRDRLALLVYSDLPAEETVQVREHLQSCSACRQEEDALRQVRHLLDMAPAPQVSIDVAQVYRQAAEGQARRTRFWRRATLAATSAAAAVVLLVVALRFEIRLEPHQVALRWADALAAAAPAPVPAPSTPLPKINPPDPAAAAKLREQMQVLGELVHGHQEELARLQNQIDELQRQIAASTQRQQSTERDVAALSSNPGFRP